MKYHVRFRRNGVRRTEFFAILDRFYPFTSLPNRKFWKIEKITWRYNHFTHVYQKSQSYDVCFLRYGVRQTLSFWVIFALLLPLQPRKLKLWKNGNTPGDIILLHMCTKNKDMECDRQNCLSFWAIFCPFTSKTTRKIKILEKWKIEHLKVLSFYICVP